MMQLERLPNGLSIRTDGDEQKQRMFFSTDPRYRTHVHPLNVPGTAYAMTRFRPVDHPWQYGVFFGLNKVNGLDFWCCGDAQYPAEIRGVMKHREIIDAGRTDSGIQFTSVNEWIGPDGGFVLEERQRIAVADQELDGSFAFDIRWELRATQTDVSIEQSDYGGLSARLVGQPHTRRHLNSEGQTGDDCADQSARWVTVAQPIDAVGTFTKETRATFAYAGLAIFDHPGNLCFPNKWRVDGQGMINPAFALSQNVEIPKGDSLVLNYRIYAFQGLEDAAAIENDYEAWVGRAK